MSGPAAGFVGSFAQAARSPVATQNRFLPLDDQGRERRIGATLADFGVTPKKPRMGKRVFAATSASLSPLTLCTSFITSSHRSLSAPVSNTDGSAPVSHTAGSPLTYTDGGCITPVSNTDGSPVTITDDLSTLHTGFDNMFDRHSSSKNMISRHLYTPCTSHTAPHNTYICSCLEPCSPNM